MGDSGENLISNTNPAASLGVKDKFLLHAAVMGLYRDQIKPHKNEVSRRLGELSAPAYLQKHCLAICEDLPNVYHVLRSSPTLIDIFLNDNPSWFQGWVDPKDPIDKYPQTTWLSLQTYFSNLIQQEKENPSPPGEPATYQLSGGRYAVAKQLKTSGPDDLRGMTLGQLCHLVQLAVNRGILVVSGAFIVPSQCAPATSARGHSQHGGHHQQQGGSNVALSESSFSVASSHRLGSQHSSVHPASLPPASQMSGAGFPAWPSSMAPAYNAHGAYNHLNHLNSMGNNNNNNTLIGATINSNGMPNIINMHNSAASHQLPPSFNVHPNNNSTYSDGTTPIHPYNAAAANTSSTPPANLRKVATVAVNQNNPEGEEGFVTLYTNEEGHYFAFPATSAEILSVGGGANLGASNVVQGGGGNAHSPSALQRSTSQSVNSQASNFDASNSDFNGGNNSAYGFNMTAGAYSHNIPSSHHIQQQQQHHTPASHHMQQQMYHHHHHHHPYHYNASGSVNGLQHSVNGSVNLHNHMDGAALTTGVTSTNGIWEDASTFSAPAAMGYARSLPGMYSNNKNINNGDIPLNMHNQNSNNNADTQSIHDGSLHGGSHASAGSRTLYPAMPPKSQPQMQAYGTTSNSTNINGNNVWANPSIGAADWASGRQNVNVHNQQQPHWS